MGKKFIPPDIDLTLKDWLNDCYTDGDQIFIGIDPGVSGCISLLRVRKSRVSLLIVDIPVKEEERAADSKHLKQAKRHFKGRKAPKKRKRTTTRRSYLWDQLARFFVVLSSAVSNPKDVHILVEEVAVMVAFPGGRICRACKRPFGQTVYSGVAVGISNGMWPMLAYALGWGQHFRYVRSGKWKPYFGLSKKSKEVSRAVAIDLFQKYQDYFARVKDHNRAEASLIAVYGFKNKDEVFRETAVPDGSEVSPV